MIIEVVRVVVPHTGFTMLILPTFLLSFSHANAVSCRTKFMEVFWTSIAINHRQHRHFYPIDAFA